MQKAGMNAKASMNAKLTVNEENTIFIHWQFSPGMKNGQT
jgi:hypothetical protein